MNPTYLPLEVSKKVSHVFKTDLSLVNYRYPHFGVHQRSYINSFKSCCLGKPQIQQFLSIDSILEYPIFWLLATNLGTPFKAPKNLGTQKGECPQDSQRCPPNFCRSGPTFVPHMYPIWGTWGTYRFFTPFWGTYFNQPMKVQYYKINLFI